MVKKYELPQQKGETDGGDRVNQGLKYMGMAGLAKGGEKATGSGSQPSVHRGRRKCSNAGNQQDEHAELDRLRKAAPGEPSQRQRKKSVAEEKEEEADRHIRFKIGGVGQRMTKEDFIEEMKKLDKNTRREVVDQSSASHVVKTLAREGPAAIIGQQGQGVSPRGEPTERTCRQAPRRAVRTPAGRRLARPRSGDGGTSRATSSSQEPPETAWSSGADVAVLRGVAGGDDDSG